MSAPKNIDSKQPRASWAWLVFVSRRYVLTRRKDKSNTASILSITALALGCAVLITVISVMNALQQRSIDGILSFNTFQVRLDDPEISLRLQDPALASRLKAAVPMVQDVVPFFDIQVMMWGYYTQPEAAYIRGMSPSSMGPGTQFGKQVSLVDGTMDLKHDGDIVLGRYLARYLNVVPGDQIKVLCFAAQDGVSRPRQYDLTVEGIMDVGFHEYNRYWSVVSLDTAAHMMGGMSGISTGFKLANNDEDLAARGGITRFLGEEFRQGPDKFLEETQTWRTFNSAIFGALRVEKLMMMAIVGLIFIVVAVNIFHALRRSVLEKTEDIGVMRALGAGPGAIQMVFITEGLIIGTTGAALGFILGVALSSNINNIFQLLDVIVSWGSGVLHGLGLPVQGGSVSLFYMDLVSSRLELPEAAGIALFAWASALVASWAASRRVSRIQPAEILRNE